jgi:hypothetical protein
MAGRPPAMSLLLPFVLVSFAANSLITRYVVRDELLDAGLLTAVRFLAGAAALVLLSIARHQRVRVGPTSSRRCGSGSMRSASPTATSTSEQPQAPSSSTPPCC